MSQQSRAFVDVASSEASRGRRRPLLIGIVGPSGSGKTYSALRLATGMSRVLGGDIYVVDTEADRALHYADRFSFRHVPFAPPHGPLDYLAAITHCVERGAGVVVVDSMTHEHSGVGGVLWQSEQLLARYGDDEAARSRNLARSFIEPKRQRRALINGIVQFGGRCAFIFCYRAHEKLDFRRRDRGGNPREMGWQPETTSPLMFEMTQQFLLPPGADGAPRFSSDIEDERRLMKSPAQFRSWFRDGVVLDEEMGERMARWSAGDAPAARTTDDPGAVIDAIMSADSLDELARLFRDATRDRSRLSESALAAIVDAKDRRKAALVAASEGSA